MSEERFKVCIDSENGVGLFDNSIRLLFIKFTNKEDAVSCKDSLKYQCNLMNELYDENERLKQEKKLFNGLEHNWNILYNEAKDKVEELVIENEKLRKQMQNYEKLLANSYVGEEERLDGFVGQYVIWEDELQEYKNKNEMIDNE